MMSQPENKGLFCMSAGRHAHITYGGGAIAEAAAVLDEFCAAEGLPAAVAWRLRVVLDEVMANVMSHAAPAAAEGGLDLWLSRRADLVEMQVSDDGPAFDPLRRPDPDVTLSLEARQPGGLGIALMKSLMDDVRYERTTRNILTVRKRIDAAVAEDEAGGHEYPAKHS
jgi:anti-sigma regulatory factor (Ser/Thr protein kinase)